MNRAGIATRRAVVAWQGLSGVRGWVRGSVMVERRTTVKLRERVARRLRYTADVIDRPSAPKAMTHWSFTFEDGLGIVFRDDQRGCPVWMLNDSDYKRAHDEAGELDPETTYVNARQAALLRNGLYR